jgi:hypothetical protein
LFTFFPYSGYLGQRPDGPLARWWFSSVGTYLVKNLPCSVLIAQTEIGDEEFAPPNPPFRYPTLAAELTALSPDLVVAAGPQAAVALKSATPTIPIVFVALLDPLAWLADVLARIASIPQGWLCELLPWNWSAHVRSVAPPQAA